MSKINNGNATTIWNGITHTYLCHRCKDATAEQAALMANAASLMLAGECTLADWRDAIKALDEVEKKLCADWEAKNGLPKLNRYDQYHGGRHPALAIA